MLATLIPLYGPDKDVHGYSLFVQKENKLLSPLTSGAAAFDGDVNIKGLDIILDKPMEEALSMVLVSKQIQDALLFKQGPLSPVYTFILDYENSNWYEVSRRIIVDNLNIDYVYYAYVDALVWFKEMFDPSISPAQ